MFGMLGSLIEFILTSTFTLLGLFEARAIGPKFDLWSGTLARLAPNKLVGSTSEYRSSSGSSAASNPLSLKLFRFEMKLLIPSYSTFLWI